MLRVNNLSVSVDGYAAGPAQSLAAPLGAGGEALHTWVFRTATGRRRMLGEDGGETGADDELLRRGDEGVGATIMGRNMFGPVRGPWAPGETWDGWWGPEPPYHHPVFVLTHHPRPSITMLGGTVFHFVTDGIEAALDRATAAAGDLDVRLGGGASAIRQYLRAGLVDELHLAIVPVLLGRGERIFDDLDALTTGCTDVRLVASPSVAHMILTRPS